MASAKHDPVRSPEKFLVFAAPCFGADGDEIVAACKVLGSH